MGPTCQAAHRALGLLIGYLHQSQPSTLPTLRHPRFYAIDGHLLIDKQTRRNLGPLDSEGSMGTSLFSTINRTCTAMGARTLREELGAPLLDPSSINSRLDAVQAFVARSRERQRVQDDLRGMGDLARLVLLAGQKTPSPRDCLSLAAALDRVARLRETLARREWPAELSYSISMLDAESDLVPEIRAPSNPMPVRRLALARSVTVSRQRWTSNGH